MQCLSSRSHRHPHLGGSCVWRCDRAARRHCARALAVLCTECGSAHSAVGHRPSTHTQCLQGLRFWWDPSKPAFSRVGQIDVFTYPHWEDQPKPLENGTEYKLITSAFLLDGGDGYTVLQQNHRLCAGRAFAMNKSKPKSPIYFVAHLSFLVGRSTRHGHRQRCSASCVRTWPRRV